MVTSKTTGRVSGTAVMDPDRQRSYYMADLVIAEEFFKAVGLMHRTQPDYSAHDLSEIRVPVVIVQSEHEEFIKREHAEYLAGSIPNAELVMLPGVRHFAPLQKPELFNSTVLRFLRRVLPSGNASYRAEAGEDC
jgi:pimeloyl-ACP methyl ester carboxylesterase